MPDPAGRNDGGDFGVSGPGDAGGQTRIATLTAAASAAAGPKRGLPPVHLWNPAFCGDIDMRIAADGSWHYMGTPIGRKPMVRLFSTILRKDPERYVLVTPVERVGIQVDDLPFLAVDMSVDNVGTTQTLTFLTNVGDDAVAGPDHPLRFDLGPDGGLMPAVRVRGDLWARLSRALVHALVERGVEETVDRAAWFGVWSGGAFFPIAPATDNDAP
jgi:hypothetical protein